MILMVVEAQGRETLFYDMIHPNPPQPTHAGSPTEGLEGALTSLKGQVATVEHKMQDRFFFAFPIFLDPWDGRYIYYYIYQKHSFICFLNIGMIISV